MCGAPGTLSTLSWSCSGASTAAAQPSRLRAPRRPHTASPDPSARGRCRRRARRRPRATARRLRTVRPLTIASLVRSYGRVCAGRHPVHVHAHICMFVQARRATAWRGTRACGAWGRGCRSPTRVAARCASMGHTPLRRAAAPAASMDMHPPSPFLARWPLPQGQLSAPEKRAPFARMPKRGYSVADALELAQPRPTSSVLAEPHPISSLPDSTSPPPWAPRRIATPCAHAAATSACRRACRVNTRPRLALPRAEHCPSSAPAPHQGAPGGSGRLGAPQRRGGATAADSRASRPTSPIPPPVAFQARHEDCSWFSECDVTKLHLEWSGDTYQTLAVV